MKNYLGEDIFTPILNPILNTREVYIENKRKNDHILTPKIESIYANEKKRTVVIKWKTGEITKVKCHESDTWDLEKGVMACITKYVLGNNVKYHNILEKYIKSVK